MSNYEKNLIVAIYAANSGYMFTGLNCANPTRAREKRYDRLYRYFGRVSEKALGWEVDPGHVPARFGKKKRLAMKEIPTVKVEFPTRRVFDGYPYILHYLRTIHNRPKYAWDLGEFIEEYKKLVDADGAGPYLVVIEQKHRLDFHIYDQGPFATPRIVTFKRS